MLPEPVARTLEQVFGESVNAVTVIEHSLYARMHPRTAATTRRRRILLAIGGAEFVANPDLVLHEYFHVLRQWEPGRLTRRRYLIESARRGNWANRFEREAREFAAANIERYLALLQDERPLRGKPAVPATCT